MYDDFGFQQEEEPAVEYVEYEMEDEEEMEDFLPTIRPVDQLSHGDEGMQVQQRGWSRFELVVHVCKCVHLGL